MERFRWKHKFIIWTEGGSKLTGEGFTDAVDKNEAARIAKRELSEILATDELDINIISIVKCKKLSNRLNTGFLCLLY